MAKLNENKLAWAAGFFDGEGCIYVAKNKCTLLKHGIRYDIRITISQVDPKPLKVVMSMFGGQLHKRTKTNGTYIYNWYLSSKKALDTIKLLLPFLILKNKEAKIALNFEKLIDHKPGHRITDKVFKQKEKIYNRLKEVKDGRYSR